MVSGDPAVFLSFDPFGGAEDSIAQRNVEVGDLSIVNDKAFRSFLEIGFVV